MIHFTYFLKYIYIFYSEVRIIVENPNTSISDKVANLDYLIKVNYENYLITTLSNNLLKFYLHSLKL